MRLRATIKRTETDTHRFIHFVFPKGVNPFMYEHVLRRNLGARPYSEAFSMNAQGESLVMFGARKRR